MKLKRLIPFRVRLFFVKKYADIMLEDAISKSEDLHDKDGHRYFVLPAVGGNLKVTNIDQETRDRRRDHRLLKKSVLKPYQLRRESFYFTASRFCKDKYNPDKMQNWELEATKKTYYRWYLRNN